MLNVESRYIDLSYNQLSGSIPTELGLFNKSGDLEAFEVKVKGLGSRSMLSDLRLYLALEGDSAGSSPSPSWN